MWIYVLWRKTKQSKRFKSYRVIRVDLSEEADIEMRELSILRFGECVTLGRRDNKNSSPEVEMNSDV